MQKYQTRKDHKWEDLPLKKCCKSCQQLSFIFETDCVNLKKKSEFFKACLWKSFQVEEDPQIGYRNGLRKMIRWINILRRRVWANQSSETESLIKRQIVTATPATKTFCRTHWLEIVDVSKSKFPVCANIIQFTKKCQRTFWTKLM